jgi:hypothetical protein
VVLSREAAMGQQWHSRGGVVNEWARSGFWLVSRAAAGASSLAPRGKRRVGDRGGGFRVKTVGGGGHVHVVHCRIGRHLAFSLSLAYFGLLDLPWPRWMSGVLPSASSVQS